VSTLLVTVVGPSRRRDLSLPAESPVYELLPTLVELVGDGDGTAEAEPDAWVLSTSAAAEENLRPDASLAASGVLDGSVLYLARSRPPAGPPLRPAAVPGPDDDRSPIDRTNDLLPPRVSGPARLARAVGAFFRSAEGRAPAAATSGWGDPRPAVLTAPERVPRLHRARRAWRSTGYQERLDAATVEPRLRRCATIAVVSPKGGVGKTTITALLGTLLAQLRRDRIVAVDTNPDYGSLGRVLTPDHRLFVDDLLNRVDEPGLTLTAVDAQLGRAAHGLMVLPAPTDPARMWRLDEAAYRKVIERLQGFVGVVLLDCGTGLQEPAAGAAIKSSDQLILVTDAEPASASLVAEAGQLLVRAGRPITLVVNKMHRGSQLNVEHFARSLPEASGLVTIPSEPNEAARLAAARFDWREAPAGWQRSVRELAVQVVSEWPALGLTLQRLAAPEPQRRS
jgi:MinD-like ATPase involved in chromosome partitioning or flagellar assembly